EPHRIPATILSRCQRYEFRRIPVAGIASRLEEIAQTDGIAVSPEALQMIAGLADGAMRDAISLLDQAKASFPGTISRDDILTLAGIVQDDFLQKTAAALLQADASSLLALVDQLVMAGRDMARFLTDLAQYFRNVLVCQVSSQPQALVRASAETLAGLIRLGKQTDSSRLIELIKGLSALLSDLRWASDARTTLEIGLIRLMGPVNNQPAAQPRPAQAEISVKTAAPEPPAEIAAPAPGATPAIKTAPAEIAAPKAPPEIAAPATSEVLLETVAPAETAPSPVLPDPEPPAATIATTAEPPSPVPAETAAASGDAAVSADDLWKNILDSLLAEGHMTLYLFSRSAQARLSGGNLQLVFPAADQVNYREACEPAARKLLRTTAARLSGRDMDVEPVLAQTAPGEGTGEAANPAAPQEDDWIQKIKKTADTLGIPVKMEE
ncbi:MAG TPA: hypothetical protein DD640_04340, partial [Clostridiales bacterium]|nr:hypothetical protein [Clostridiales bacterium]